jgi:hypothetical protein
MEAGNFGSGVKKMGTIISRGAAFTSLAVLSFGVLGFTGSAKGVLILPGQALPTTGAGSFGGTKIADTGSLPFTGLNAVNSTVFTGLLDTQVYADSGGLDFVYQFSNSANSIDSIERLTASGFSGYTTDADYIAGSGAAGPFLVSSSSNGDTIGFSFLSASDVAPGQTSDILVIKTDALAFTASTVSVSDGGVANVDSFSPTAVPEPASMAMAAFGFSALGLRRRKGNQQIK